MIFCVMKTLIHFGTEQLRKSHHFCTRNHSWWRKAMTISVLQDSIKSKLFRSFRSYLLALKSSIGHLQFLTVRNENKNKSIVLWMNLRFSPSSHNIFSRIVCTCPIFLRSFPPQVSCLSCSLGVIKQYFLQTALEQYSLLKAQYKYKLKEKKILFRCIHLRVVQYS